MDIQKHILTRPGFLEDLVNLPNEPMPDHRIISAKIKLLWQCNLSCMFCELPQTSSRLTLDDVTDILTSLRKLGTEKVHFSGGEIFLHHEVFDILDCAVQAGFQVNITTNGTLLDKTGVRRLSQLGVHSVSISIDGSSAKRHDRLRGQKGAFKATLKTLVHLAGLTTKGPKIRVNTVVSRENFHDLDDLHSLLLGISNRIQWRLILIHSEDKERLLTKSMAKELALKIPNWPLVDGHFMTEGIRPKEYKNIANGQYAAGIHRAVHCYMPWIHVFVDPSAYVYPCCRLRGSMRSLGNLHDQDMETILSGPVSQSLRLNMASGQPREICYCCDDFWDENERIYQLVKSQTFMQQEGHYCADN